MTNKYQPHVLIFPEDEANRQIANGFLLRLPQDRLRRVQVLNPVGGWSPVRNALIECRAGLIKHRERRVIGLLDFDRSEGRRDKIFKQIDPAVQDRVFILGARSNPEELKKDFKGFEAIGKALADDCMNGTNNTWTHPLLSHNAAEIARMQADIATILFGRG
jgi:hypothetical protein